MQIKDTSTRKCSISTSPFIILGGGPAGSAAALALLKKGRAPTIVERSHFPRHKVCGEFLSPEILPLLRSVGMESPFLALEPARVTSMRVHLGSTVKWAPLPQPAFGLSRFAFDKLLLDAAVTQGASLAATTSEPAAILACGRTAQAEKGSRLFGFKAHFTGPIDQAVELFFFKGAYVGINCVEGQRTNVCGLAPEPVLQRCGFKIDELLCQSPALRARTAPLRRSMEWMFTGPLVFGNRLKERNEAKQYLAGDALSFVDPFTGSGLLSAIATGMIAGSSAAAGFEPQQHLARCGEVLGAPFEVSSLLRRLAGSNFAGPLLSVVPSALLFWATRPRTAMLRVS